VSDAQLKTQCKQQYEALRDQVVQLLASFKWIEGEADEMELKVSDKDVEQEIAEIKKQQFPRRATFEKFLKDSGFTQRGHPPADQAGAAHQQDPRQGHQGLGQGQPGRDQGLLRQEQAALRPA
jgi:hypothetical protein